jgi:L-alanine-DL-glutamate epimerase-like enolase superfamily enzyme
LTQLVQDLKNILIGKDPRNIDKLWRKMCHSTSGAGSVAGIVHNAITGIETALWDLLGKHLIAPVYQLLGGKFRDKVRDCHGGEGLECYNSILQPIQPAWLKKEGEFSSRDADPSANFLARTIWTAIHRILTPEGQEK